MVIKELIAHVKKKACLKINEKDLELLLSKSKVVKEKDTLISGKLRLLNYQNNLLIQEQSNKDELLIRFMQSKVEANKFIDERLEIYDRMWDGCGCKVDYYK
jgi:hypothetical protein